MSLIDGPLDSGHIEHFIDFGFVRVDGCFDAGPGTIAADWIERHWRRSGYDPDDPRTWERAKVHWPGERRVPIREFAPKAWESILQLCGGAERVSPHLGWSDAFIANYRFGSDQTWEPPHPEQKGWHKDGDFFRHYLDSPEQGLLTIVLWSDVLHRGGPTYIAADSVAPVARALLAHPEGLWPGSSAEAAALEASGFPQSYLASQEWIRECSDFREATGRAGDVYLIHPFVLHRPSQNVLGRARLITNPPIRLVEPMCFDRWDGTYSPVEACVLRALGVERIDFRPITDRMASTPPRLAEHARLKLEIAERLAAAERNG